MVVAVLIDHRWPIQDHADIEFIATVRLTAPIAPDLVGKLQAAFMSAACADELKAERDMLLIADFVIPERAPYQALRARAEAAAIYPDVW